MSSLLNSIDFQYVIGALVKIAVFWIFIMLVVAYTVYAERRVLAVIQNRLGPNRVGWQGLLQPFADLLKFIFKEDIIPLAVNKWLYVLAPIIVLIPAMMVLIVYPFGPGDVPLPFGADISHTLNNLGASFGMSWNIDLSKINLYVTNMNVGLLYVFAMTSLGIYGIVMPSLTTSASAVRSPVSVRFPNLRWASRNASSGVMPARRLSAVRCST